MNRKTLKWVMIVFVIMIVALILYNCIFNYCSFFKVNAINCINALIALGLSFFIVQRQTDYRKQKDIFINLLESLKNLVDDEKSYKLTNVEKEEMLMRSRDIALKVEIIQHYSDRFNIRKEDASFLEDKLKEYQTVIDNHSTDMELLCKIHKELERPLNLMSQKIFEIMLNLYN